MLIGPPISIAMRFYVHEQRLEVMYSLNVLCIVPSAILHRYMFQNVHHEINAIIVRFLHRKCATL